MPDRGAEPQFSWNRPFLCFAEAEGLLKSACFHFHPCSGPRWSATGFFVSREGLALTADHSLRPDPSETLLTAHYGGDRLELEWVKEWSSEDADIAVLRLCGGPRDPEIRWLTVGYLDPGAAWQSRCRSWAGRRACVFGFPVRGERLEGCCLEAAVDASTPLVTLTEATPEGGQAPAERLNLVANRRLSSLEGMSGAPILDLQLCCIIAVQGSYDVQAVLGGDGRHYVEGSGRLLGSEIAQLVDKAPAVAKRAGFVKLEYGRPKAAAPPTWL